MTYSAPLGSLYSFCDEQTVYDALEKIAKLAEIIKKQFDKTLTLK